MGAEPRPLWLDLNHIAEVLAQLTPGSKTVVRLQVMHWTGMRPSQMGRLRPKDFRLDEADTVCRRAARQGRASGRADSTLVNS